MASSSISFTKKSNWSTSWYQCNILCLLFATAFLIFFSSFLTLSHPHIENLHGNGKHIFLSRSKQTHTLPDIQLPTTESAQPQAENQDQQTISHIPDDSPPPIEHCRLHFKSKCRISPYIHYWNDETECAISPFRALHGLDAPREQQKFIVFQPDLGGWNNIRMALEVVILFAQITGRILVMPPPAILYLLHMNKKWGDNKSTMEDYFDFDRLQVGNGLQVISMKEFLETIASQDLLDLPLPENNTELIKQPLWDYLEKACYCRQWEPGKSFVAFHLPPKDRIPAVEITKEMINEYVIPSLSSFSTDTLERIDRFTLGHKRQVVYYNESFHQHRAIYFPGHDKNRLLTHFYSYLFMMNREDDNLYKRYIRDRLRYHDEIFCYSTPIIEQLVEYQLPFQPKELIRSTFVNKPFDSTINVQEVASKTKLIEPYYVAYHIRRGDFQQKHTRLACEDILKLTMHLIPNPKQRIVYIATDESNLTFFQPFKQYFAEIYFLSNFTSLLPTEMNSNYIGMIEQVICASSDIFIGTPLSTYTAYITRMRGYLNRSINIHEDDIMYSGIRQMDRSGLYNRTYYFMKHFMYQLHQKPYVGYPLWVRDYVDVFQNIDD